MPHILPVDKSDPRFGMYLWAGVLLLLLSLVQVPH